MSVFSNDDGGGDDDAKGLRVAIVGGGISGCAAARQLVAECSNNNNDKNVQVTLFDWGRSVGGRASHRFRPEPSTENPDQLLELHFDHGAQFFHATNTDFLDMVRNVVQQWPSDLSRLGWLERDTGKFISSREASSAVKASNSFFGCCDTTLDDKRYVGIGGMDALAKEMLRGAQELAPGCIQVREGTRVARCERVLSKDGNRKYWKLFGDGLGHEQANATALEESTENVLGEFDELVISDHMAAAMPSWHPCHIDGLEDAASDLVSTLREALDWNELERRFTTVKPLFSCMVAFERDRASPLSSTFDAAAIQDSSILQWVCSQDSRPHEQTATDNQFERWILMSTTDFAAKCLASEGMSQKSSSKVDYIPQTDDYLRSDPAKLMCDEFFSIMKNAKGARGVMPHIVYSKCQRWGAAFTVPPRSRTEKLKRVLKSHEVDHCITVCGDFLNALSSSGDCSQSETNSFAIQEAALSGIDAANRIVKRVKTASNNH